MDKRRTPIYMKLVDYLASCQHQDAQYRVGKALLENIDEFPNIYIETIAYQANTTPPTVTKFAKKIGYASFKDLREDIEIYLAEEVDAENNLASFLIEDSKRTEQFFQQLNFTRLHKQVMDIVSHEQIIILNSDYSTPFCNQLRTIFERKKHKVYLLDRNVDKRLLLDLAQENTVIIIVSLSGRWMQKYEHVLNELETKRIRHYLIAPEDISNTATTLCLPNQKTLFTSYYHSLRYLSLLGKAIEFSLADR